MPERAEQVPVRVSVTVTYSLPADMAEREHLYGTTEPSECVFIDFDNDPAAFFMEADDLTVDAVEMDSCASGDTA